MKLLTRTQSAGVVIELNQSEFLELRMLIEAVEGKTLDEIYQVDYFHDGRSYTPNEVDLSSAFGAIKAFYSQKFRVNDIERGLSVLKDALKETDERL